MTSTNIASHNGEYFSDFFLGIAFPWPVCSDKYGKLLFSFNFHMLQISLLWAMALTTFMHCPG